MPKYTMPFEDLVAKSRNAFDAEDEAMYADAAGIRSSEPDPTANPDVVDLDDDDFE